VAHKRSKDEPSYRFPLKKIIRHTVAYNERHKYHFPAEELECGHMIATKNDLYGHQTAAYKRRCRDCYIIITLADTCMLDNQLCDEIQTSLEHIEEVMTNAGYERCSECETWCETSELVDEESEPCPCENCRK